MESKPDLLKCYIQKKTNLSRSLENSGNCYRKTVVVETKEAGPRI